MHISSSSTIPITSLEVSLPTLPPFIKSLTIKTKRKEKECHTKFLREIPSRIRNSSTVNGKKITEKKNWSEVHGIEHSSGIQEVESESKLEKSLGKIYTRSHTLIQLIHASWRLALKNDALDNTISYSYSMTWPGILKLLSLSKIY